MMLRKGKNPYNGRCSCLIATKQTWLGVSLPHRENPGENFSGISSHSKKPRRIIDLVAILAKIRRRGREMAGKPKIVGWSWHPSVALPT
jgi:hypothetical protein